MNEREENAVRGQEALAALETILNESGRPQPDGSTEQGQAAIEQSREIIQQATSALWTHLRDFLRSATCGQDLLDSAVGLPLQLAVGNDRAAYELEIANLRAEPHLFFEQTQNARDKLWVQLRAESGGNIVNRVEDVGSLCVHGRGRVTVEATVRFGEISIEDAATRLRERFDKLREQPDILRSIFRENATPWQLPLDFSKPRFGARVDEAFLEIPDKDWPSAARRWMAGLYRLQQEGYLRIEQVGDVCSVTFPSNPATKDDDTRGQKRPAVELNDREQSPRVLGDSVPKLTDAQYDVVRALLEAGPEGLNKDDLDEESRHPDARKILGRLAKKKVWRGAIVMAEGSGLKYRLRWIRP